MATTATKLNSNWKIRQDDNTKTMDLESALGRMNTLSNQEACVRMLRSDTNYIEGLIGIIDISTNAPPKITKEQMILGRGDYDIIRAKSIWELGKYLESAPLNNDDIVIRIVGLVKKVHLEKPVAVELNGGFNFYNNCAKQMASHLFSTIEMDGNAWAENVRRILGRK